MDPVHSGTGVFYQAMPAVGANGKNIMKLIPVQMVNGRFVQTHISKPKTNPTLQESTLSTASALTKTARKESSSQPGSQEFIKKQVACVNILPKQAESAHSNSVNQQETAKLMEKVPQVAALPTNLGNSVRLSHQLPVTVKSPVLPRGQCLRIPPTAQVQRVPASQLPPRVKEQIFTSSTGSPADSGLNSVVYVSPVATVNQGPTESDYSASQTLKLLSEASKTATSKGTKPHLKLIPRVSQRPNSPTRWVIEEEDSSAAENQKHTLSPSVTSEIIQSVAGRENKEKLMMCQSGQGNDGQGQENALVVCNGKVFFVANKCSSSLKFTGAPQISNLNKSTIPPPLPPPPHLQQSEAAAPQAKQNLRASSELSEVIDLCDDDDAQQDLTQHASSTNTSSVSHPDEDNVIFVSYIPPKSESTTKTHTGILKETVRTTSSRSNSSTDVSVMRGREHGQNIPVRRDGGSDLESWCVSSTQQLDNMEVDEESLADHSNSRESPQTEQSAQLESSTHPVPEWRSPQVPELRQRSDNLLRRMFGITADVKICLQKIDEASPGCVSADFHLKSMRSVELEKPISSLKKKDLLSQDVFSQKERGIGAGLDTVNMKTASEHELSEPHQTRMTPLKSSHFKLNSEARSALKESCCLGQSSHNRTCHTEPDPVVGYVEPIDEDFPDENDIPTSQSSATHPQTCEDVSTNTRRVGRTRKRTMCPCCIPTALHPAVKSSARLEEPETLATELTSKKTGRTKAQRKDGKTSGRISCLDTKSKQNCKMHEALSTASTCELKRPEKSERLRDLLNKDETQNTNSIS